MVRDAVFALLDAETDLTYTMYIHDPNYLLMAGNPLVFSRIYIVHSKLKSSGRNGSAEYFYLTAHKHEKLEFDPLGRKKCTLTPNYNYMACIEEYGARTIGCHPSWDSNFGDYPNCTTLEQLRKHNDLYQIYYNEDKNTIESLTGCLEPCNYFEYKIVGDKQSFIFPDPTSFMIGFNFVSTSYQILKEEPLYPLDSFVGEFGGAFGLFLGASFLSFWDLLEYLVTKISKLGKLK
ncbi:uncharacterized protein LOC111714239 [Eurytemora carolleeae]|uniref:uncharacterized protein LOC111714239 n=1 Tax=Eurytemora carolleeae TaxID=1294199 RepID=UPI000C7569DE|nr:uncharacterized protein LOC111714239 [Eurytemora carolleeae]|eukprot:XP_023345069.1 uncharacterized protein LOC111714239 [Eurytemora affinis]